jgi:hypothetical protein
VTLAIGSCFFLNLLTADFARDVATTIQVTQ